MSQKRSPRKSKHHAALMAGVEVRLNLGREITLGPSFRADDANRRDLGEVLGHFRELKLLATRADDDKISVTLVRTPIHKDSPPVTYSAYVQNKGSFALPDKQEVEVRFTSADEVRLLFRPKP